MPLRSEVDLVIEVMKFHSSGSVSDTSLSTSNLENMAFLNQLTDISEFACVYKN